MTPFARHCVGCFFRAGRGCQRSRGRSFEVGAELDGRGGEIQRLRAPAAHKDGLAGSKPIEPAAVRAIVADNRCSPHRLAIMLAAKELGAKLELSHGERISSTISTSFGWLWRSECDVTAGASRTPPRLHIFQFL